MKTRDSEASINGNAQNARQRLGQAIEFYMRQADCDDHRVSRTCSASAKDVEQWRKGEVVPSPDQWSKLKRSVNHTLGRFADLYQRARTEAENDARERAVVNMNKERPPMRADTKINTALADKLGAVTIEKPAPSLRVVEAPPEAQHGKTLASHDLGQEVRGNAVDGRKLAPLRPAGAASSSQIERRKNFVRDLLRRAPNKRTSGADSVIEHVRKTFGIGISPDTVEEIRDELNRERIKAEIMAELPPPQPPTLPAMAAQIIEHIATPSPSSPPPRGLRSCARRSRERGPTDPRSPTRAANVHPLRRRARRGVGRLPDPQGEDRDGRRLDQGAEVMP